MEIKINTNWEEKVLQLLSKNKNKLFKFKSIVRRIGIETKKEESILKQVLSQLEKNKSLKRVSGKYYQFSVSVIEGLSGIYFSKNGYGIVKTSDREVFISRKNSYTALDGDEVKVKIWKNENKFFNSEFEGEIVSILNRSKEKIIGRVEKNNRFIFVIPDDKNKFPQDIYIVNSKFEDVKTGDKVVVVIDNWKNIDFNPEGKIVEILGYGGELAAEMRSVILDFNLPQKFSSEIEEETNLISEIISTEEIKKRIDLRKKIVFTIDPIDAKDFDDAVSLEILENGNYYLGVHIADVSHFIKENSKLDRESQKRGTSVYLADQVIPMLPEKLSNEICSLKPNQNRLTYSCFAEITNRGTIKNYSIQKSIIKSCRRFTYEEVQKIIDEKKGDYVDDVLLMNKLKNILLKKRVKEGSINFSSDEIKFKLDEFGKPIEVIKKTRIESNSLIEEFMLLANQIVASHISKISKQKNILPFVYRVHDDPPQGKVLEFSQFVKHLGYNFDAHNISSFEYQKLMSEVKGKDEENLINEIAIRSMSKAIYTTENIGHFGLAFKHYTHFTSPIRRYPDLIVHRLLYQYESSLFSNISIEKLDSICSHSSNMEQIAINAERESMKVMQIEYLKKHIGDEFEGVISGVTNFGIFVEIKNILAEGLIKIKNLDDDYYIYDEKKHSLIGRHTKKKYRLGDSVNVKVLRVDAIDRKIDFLLI